MILYPTDGTSDGASEYDFAVKDARWRRVLDGRLAPKTDDEVIVMAILKKRQL